MTCPICKAKTHKIYRPFCSKRCADIDLGRWFTGAYRVPTEDTAEGPESDEAKPNRP